ncbi:MAG TPA: magnesium chelatase subunit H, partial [Desulfobacteraceae bacterium]|nr:magnesium chelatase subunit H [Desulfobacteraceae bacterium]
MPYQITFISVSDSGLRYLDEVLGTFSKEDFCQTFKAGVEIKTFFVGEDKDFSNIFSSFEEAILSSNILLLDLMGAGSAVSENIEKIVEKFHGNLVLIGSGSEYLRSRIRLGSFSINSVKKMMKSKKNKKTSFDMEKMLDRMETIGKLAPLGPLKDMRNMILLGKFWRYAGFENIKNMLLLLCSDYGKIKGLPKPGELIDYSRYVLFDPEKLQGFKNLAELQDKFGWDKNKKTIGILFHSFNYPNYSFGILSKVIKYLKKKYNVVPFGISFGSDKFKKINRIIDEGLRLELVWNFLPFRFGAGPMGGDPEAGLNIFRRFNVPVLHPFFLGKRKITDWEEKLTSLGPMEVIIQIMLPELDGVIETIPIAALGDKPYSEKNDLKELSLITHRFDKLTARSETWINLRNKNNKKKKIAFILYNYPPGEGNVGGGSFLDTFKSVERITSSMKDAGYSCEQISSLKLEEIFMNKGVCNSSKWFDKKKIKTRYNLGKYLSRTKNDLHKFMVERIAKDWGEAPGEIMTDTDSFLVPGIIEGNIFVGLQPSRGLFEDPSRLYHDKELSPHHQYLAFYRWLEKEFKADVVIHVGTHGTLEFLPGKESALTNRCFPDYMMGKMAHLYLYYTGNPSEATIAKRRTYACMISYSGPMFKRFRSYGDYVELENMIDEYMEAKELALEKESELLAHITRKVSDMKLVINGDLTVDNISGELIRLKTSLMPAGLHEIGKPFTEKEKESFLSAILCWNRGEIRSLKEIIENEYYALKLYLPGKSKKNMIEKEEQIFKLADSLVNDYFFGEKKLYNQICKKLSHAGRKKIKDTFKYGERSLRLIEDTDEIGGLLNGMDGNYTEARLGGDLIRDPEIFPTGHNIFQFDPRLVPSKTAMERGDRIAKSTIDYYLNNEKKYPESVTVVLWGLETSRTKGETIGQILSYLGVKIKKGSDSWEKKIKITPLKDLGRPRIDCLITICGFFRDMFPNMIDLLDEIFEAVSLLDESEKDNYIRKHSKKNYENLKATMDETSAFKLSSARMFGPPEGEYGTGITTMVGAGTWKEEIEIAKAYLTAQKHVYTRSQRGQAQESLFKENLKKVDIVSQVRSSVDYSFMDLDHYYEYFGGLVKSVETVKGTKPEMLITDSSSNIIYTDEAKKAIEIGVRTRLLNPEYIKDMLKHRVHGAQEIAKRAENLIGLAATTGRVDSWIFDAIKHTFVDDNEIYDKLIENNRFAAADIIMRLFEAEKRGYWDASDNELEKLR